MSIGSKGFNNAELAMAAYANLTVGSTSLQSNIDALTSAEAGGSGMTEAQAIAFSDRYPTIVASQSETTSGFSATVFKDSDEQLTVAIRGTADVADLIADVDLSLYGAAHDQIVDMVNWW